MISLVTMLFVLKMISLHGPGGQMIELNPGEVISLREPSSQEHFAKSIKCIVSTSDGKFHTVLEDCNTVKQMLEGDHEGGD